MPVILLQIPAENDVRHYDVTGKLCPDIIGWNEDSGNAKKCEEFNKNATSYKGGYTDSTSRFDTESEDGKTIMALKNGPFTLLVTDSAIALVQKVKLNTGELITGDSRESLLVEYKYEDFIKELQSYAEKEKNVTFNDKAFEKFGSSSRDFSELSIPTSYY